LSTPVKTRAEFQHLAAVRLEEAKILLDAGKWDGAYYLAGYAIELALKACIIKTLMATDAFPEKKFSDRCYTHDIGGLVTLADMMTVWLTATTTDSKLSGNWGIAKEWSEQKRYHQITEAEARDLYAAVADAAHGVLPWIKTYW